MNENKFAQEQQHRARSGREGRLASAEVQRRSAARRERDRPPRWTRARILRYLYAEMCELESRAPASTPPGR